MGNSSRGFGSGASSQGVVSRTPTDAGRELEGIRERIAPSIVLNQYRFAFASVTSPPIRIEVGAAAINTVSVTVRTGTIGIHLGDATSQDAVAAFEFTAGDTKQVKIPLDSFYIFTVIPIGVGASGSIVVMAV